MIKLYLNASWKIRHLLFDFDEILCEKHILNTIITVAPQLAAVLLLLYIYQAIADPTLQRRPAAAGELYIPQSSWPFSSSFFTLFPCINISFYYFYRFSRHTLQHITKIHVSKSQILKFLWDSEMRFFLLFPQISVPTIFKHFPI